MSVDEPKIFSKDELEKMKCEDLEGHCMDLLNYREELEKEFWAERETHYAEAMDSLERVKQALEHVTDEHQYAKERLEDMKTKAEEVYKKQEGHIRLAKQNVAEMIEEAPKFPACRDDILAVARKTEAVCAEMEECQAALLAAMRR
jgi:hypothetical protein